MKFFVDTANLEEITRLHALGLVDGVTTNPSIIAKEGVNLEDRIKAIAHIIDGPISAEVLTEDPEEMITQGREYASWAPNIYVKIPMTPAGMQALQTFSKEGIKTNVTLVFSVNQALIAAKLGATLVSPFVGRLDDIGHDGMELINDIITVYANYGFTTEVLVASVRSTKHVQEAAVLGADIATIPPDLFNKLFTHNLTDDGQAKFLADWQSTQK